MSLDYIALLLAQQQMRDQFEAAPLLARERAPRERTPVPRLRYTLTAVFRQLAYRLEPVAERP